MQARRRQPGDPIQLVTASPPSAAEPTGAGTSSPAETPRPTPPPTAPPDEDADDAEDDAEDEDDDQDDDEDEGEADADSEDDGDEGDDDDAPGDSETPAALAPSARVILCARAFRVAPVGAELHVERISGPRSGRGHIGSLPVPDGGVRFPQSLLELAEPGFRYRITCMTAEGDHAFQVETPRLIGQPPAPPWRRPAPAFQTGPAPSGPPAPPAPPAFSSFAGGAARDPLLEQLAQSQLAMQAQLAETNKLIAGAVAALAPGARGPAAPDPDRTALDRALKIHDEIEERFGHKGGGKGGASDPDDPMVLAVTGLKNVIENSIPKLVDLWVSGKRIDKAIAAKHAGLEVVGVAVDNG